MSIEDIRVYEFEHYRLDALERRLLRGGLPVPLTSKVFDLLLTLVQNSGHLMMKEELMRQLWDEQFVEDNNLTVRISMLRKALGDEKRGRRYIETVSRRGYRFVAQTRVLQPYEVGCEWEHQPNLNKSIRSIAVFPFSTPDEEPGSIYLVQGLTDALIFKLNKIKNVVILPMSPILELSGHINDPVTTGKLLRLDAVLYGHIKSAFGRLQVAVSLIDVRGGEPLWLSEFDENFVGIFAAQDSISEKVLKELKPKLSGERDGQAVRSPGETPILRRLPQMGTAAAGARHIGQENDRLVS